jgi:hypothetical protein
MEPVYKKSASGAWYGMEGRFCSMDVRVTKYQPRVMKATGSGVYGC